MNPSETYIDVLIPLSLPQPLTYVIPEHLIERAKLGCRALVTLGSTKYCSAIIINIHKNPPQTFIAKPIEDILDENPIFDVEKQLKFFTWIEKYYMSNIGEVMQASLPSVFKITSETKIGVHPDFDGDISELNDVEGEIIDYILKSTKDINLAELKKDIDKKGLFKSLSNLYTKAIIIIYEEAKDKHIPKIEKFIYLNQKYREHENLRALYQQLEKKVKQLDIFLFFQSNAESDNEGNLKMEFKKFDFTILSKSSLNTLVEKSVFIKKIIQVSRFPDYIKNLVSLPNLSTCQLDAIEKTKNSIIENKITLFYGSHHSGKSIIQLHLLNDFLQKGKQVLYLVPEIALSEYLVNEFKKYFGYKVLAYNSKYSDQERAEVWSKVASGGSYVIVAVRNGIFLPFRELGCIIVDSEHDESYKQNERSPRYNARDSSIMLGKLHSVPVILFSATPSIESFFNATNHKFGFISLQEAYNKVEDETIKLKNFTQASREKRVREEFTIDLIEEIQSRLKLNEKILIFQSKKGYAPYVSCRTCAAVPKCINCNVSLTYHQYYHTLKCHFCGYKQNMIDFCRECGSSFIKNVGFGTEKLEETLIQIFPEVKVLRFDPETTKSKKSLSKLIDAINNSDADIFLGTQILTKGFNFQRVSLAAIMQIDHILHSQDFRAHERCFQTISNVCSKATFGENRLGFVQTTNTKHSVLQWAMQHDYFSLYQNEIKLRRKNQYPPFSNIIKISFYHKVQAYVEHASDFLYQFLLPYAKEVSISIPVSPVVNRIRNEYILDIWIKIPKNSNQPQSNYKKILESKIESCKKVDKKFRACKIIIDVDV